MREGGKAREGAAALGRAEDMRACHRARRTRHHRVRVTGHGSRIVSESESHE